MACNDLDLEYLDDIFGNYDEMEQAIDNGRVCTPAVMSKSQFCNAERCECVCNFRAA